VELIGLTPQYEEDGETPVTRNLQHSSGNKYIYYVGTGTPTSDMASVTLALTATGPVGSTAIVNLSTENITENPNLYVPASVSTTIRGPEFTNLRFNNNNNYTMPLGLNQTTTFSFTYTTGMVVPITITMDGLTLNGADTRMTDNGNGTWTFTPTSESTVTYTINVKSTTRFSPVTVTLSHEDYTEASKTANRSTFTIPANALSISNGPTRNRTNYTLYAYPDDSFDTELSSSAENNDSRNNAQMTIDLSRFTNPNDDTLVYFRLYRGYYYTTYYATARLADVYAAQNTNNGRLTLNFSTTQP